MARRTVDSRRRSLLGASLASLVAVPLRGEARSGVLDEARAREQQQVDALYSTKPVRVRGAGREFVVPANYLTPKGRDLPSTVEYGFLQFALFLPEFGGFTRTNWQQGWFHPMRIDIVEASEGNAHRTPQRFLAVRRQSLESGAFREVAGLSGYRWRNRQIGGATYCGDTPAGEFFCLETTHAPDDPVLPDTHPLCKVQYFRESRGMFLAYRYSMDHLEDWAQIDRAIWDKLEQWAVK